MDDEKYNDKSNYDNSIGDENDETDDNIKLLTNDSILDNTDSKYPKGKSQQNIINNSNYAYNNTNNSNYNDKEKFNDRHSYQSPVFGGYDNQNKSSFLNDSKPLTNNDYLNDNKDIDKNKKDTNLDESKLSSSYENEKIIKDNNQMNLRNSYAYYEPKELLDKIVYGEYQYRIILLSVLLLVMEGAEVSFIAYLITSLRQYFDASTFEIEVTAAIIYVGLGIGSFFVDYVKSYLNRRLIVIYCLVGINICHILVIFAQSIIFFTLLRFIIGIMFGLVCPITLNVLCEYLPIEYRNFTMNSIYCGFNLGQLLLLLTQRIVAPKFEQNQIITILLCFWLWVFLSTIAFYFYFEDSPRNLILTGEINKGMRIYRHMLKDNHIYISSEQRKSIIEYVEKTNDRIKDAHFKAVYTDEFFKVSILLSFIWFLNSHLRYGPILIYTETLQQLEISSNSDIILNHILIALGMFLSNFLFSWIAEFKLIGLVRISLISYVLAIIFNILIVAIPSKINIWFSIASVLYNPANSAMSTYTHLIYPTKIRDTSFGLFLFYKRIGGIISQFVFLGFFSIGYIIPYYILLFITLIITILIYYLPFEPSLEHLDEVHHQFKPLT